MIGPNTEKREKGTGLNGTIPVHPTSSLKIRSQRTDALVIVSVNK